VKGLDELLGAPKDKPSEPAAEGDDLKDAAQDVLDAIKDSDVDALALALRRAHEVCAGGYDDEEATDEE